MPITAFDHYTIRCADLDKSWAFYRDGLGLRVEPRPVASTRAALVFLESEWLVHLFQATPEQESIFRAAERYDPATSDWRTGHMQHIALRATELNEMKARLQHFGAAFREQRRGDRHQIIVQDPDGVELELNFPISEPN